MEELTPKMGEAEWVRREMLDHFHTTGQFRPEDLARVLGSPRTPVDMSRAGNYLDSFQVDNARV